MLALIKLKKFLNKEIQAPTDFINRFPQYFKAKIFCLIQTNIDKVTEK